MQFVEDENPTDSRQRILTLHVLFPSLVLPALDLLDRNLVKRVALISESRNCDGVSSRTTKHAQEPMPDFGGTDFSNLPLSSEMEHPVYLVHIVESGSKRTTTADVDNRSTVYTVQLAAWSCTCAEFTLDKFGEGDRKDIQDLDSAAGSEGQVYSGQPSDVGPDDARVPCCKHLLACFLAENWNLLSRETASSVLTESEMASLASLM